MKHYSHIIIGFGKAGKTLAAKLAAEGETVALIEKSNQMYGGTCINIACIPSKALEFSARRSDEKMGDFTARAERYRQAVEQKNQITGMLRQKNYNKLKSVGVDIIDGKASFVDAHTLKISTNDSTQTITGDRIYINTGAYSFIPPIEGIRESRFVRTSESMMDDETLPEHMVILGGGYIGLEFASYYTNFGAKVTILQDSDDFIPREDSEVAQVIYDSFVKRGITIVKNAKVTKVEDHADQIQIYYDSPEGSKTITGNALLVATGRRPLVDGLDLDNAGVELTKRNGVAADEHLVTSQEHIIALGDVRGDLQFTYISLDDFRIAYDTVTGKNERTTRNRGEVPYTVFIDPPLSRVGITEREAKEKGLSYKVATLPAAAIPKAHILRQTTGLLKVLVDQTTEKILGAHLFCAESHEMINLFKRAMDDGLMYQVLRDAIYTHPTMTESLNEAFQFREND